MTTLDSFDSTDGVNPFAALIQATYGTTVLREADQKLSRDDGIRWLRVLWDDLQSDPEWQPDEALQLFAQRLHRWLRLLRTPSQGNRRRLLRDNRGWRV